jgi:hypothetical protein
MKLLDLSGQQCGNRDGMVVDSGYFDLLGQLRFICVSFDLEESFSPSSCPGTWVGQRVFWDD